MKIRKMQQREALAVLSVLLLLLFTGCSPSSVSSGSGRVVDEGEYLPALDEFVPVDIIPEMIHYETPTYPRLALQAGLEGAVFIRALVVTNGSVHSAVVHESSGTQSLDEAALKAARKCRFKPALQNGRPVATWAMYKVNFELDDTE